VLFNAILGSGCGAVMRSERRSIVSGGGGIRTHGALACTLVFETSTIVQAACARRGGCRSDAALPPIRIAAKIEGTCVIDSGS
jgi:hypothetical protein